VVVFDAMYWFADILIVSIVVVRRSAYRHQEGSGVRKSSDVAVAKSGYVLIYKSTCDV
jgi:hypothetical protein